jgi:hypothetical protein
MENSDGVGLGGIDTVDERQTLHEQSGEHGCSPILGGIDPVVNESLAEHVLAHAELDSPDDLPEPESLQGELQVDTPAAAAEKGAVAESDEVGDQGGIVAHDGADIVEVDFRSLDEFECLGEDFRG